MLDESTTDLPFPSRPSSSIEVKDISLTDYIQVRHAVYVPHTAGRYAKKQFAKGRMPIVERLVNSLMMKGRNNGKKLMAVRIVAHAFEIVHLLTDLNPIQVLVDAIVNTGPREDSTRIGSAGTVRRQAVDVSPLRRVNQAVSLLTIGTRESAFRNIKSISECLADELINAAKGSSNSYAIKKKVRQRFPPFGSGLGLPGGSRGARGREGLLPAVPGQLLTPGHVQNFARTSLSVSRSRTANCPCSIGRKSPKRFPFSIDRALGQAWSAPRVSVFAGRCDACLSRNESWARRTCWGCRRAALPSALRLPLLSSLIIVY